MSLKSKNMMFVCLFVFFLFSIRVLGFNLVKTPQRLGNWFQRYGQLKDWANKKKRNFQLCFPGFVWQYLKNSICEFRLILLDYITNVYSPFRWLVVLVLIIPTDISRVGPLWTNQFGNTHGLVQTTSTIEVARLQ